MIGNIMLENEGATPVEDEILDTPVETVSEPKTMDDTLRETLRSIQSKDDSYDPTPESAEQKAERIRDRQGKFVKQKVGIGYTEPVNKAEPVESAEPVQETPAEPVVPPKAAPNTWRKQAQEKFASLPPDIQDEVLRREQDFFKGIEQYKGKAEFATRMERAITPHIDTLQSMGVSPDTAVSELLMADRKLRYGSPQEKQQYFAYLAQSYGIDPTSLQVQQNVQVDPNVEHLQRQVQQLSGYVQQQQLLSQRQEEQALTGEIQKFASDPSNRHFESVRGDMAALLQAGIAKDLQDAYERAIYANPTTRAAVLAEQQAAARAKAGQRVQAARTASSVNVRPRPSMPVSQPIGSMDDTIRATLRRLTNA